MNKNFERTFIMFKPDTVSRGLVGEILARLEKRGLKLVAMKMIQVSKEQAAEHYKELQGKFFYDGLVDFITSAPVIPAVVEGLDAIKVVRSTLGATFCLDAAPGTVRGDFGISKSRNLIHGSDSAESVARETAIYFSEEEILDWDRDLEKILYAWDGDSVE